MVMSFSVKQAREFLFSNGFIYTFRTRKRKCVGKDWIRKGKKSKLKIADVYIEFVKQIKNGRELEPYAEHSGFATVQEWITQIYKLHYKRKTITGYLYKVTLSTYSYKTTES